MNIIQFNFKQIKSRPLSSVLNTILFATGVTIISLVFLLKDSFENQMDKNAGGIDLVVGAKGSPLQLILSGIYHVDYPTGNIDYNEAIELSKNPLIKEAIPLALGDNFNGFRIVGTNKAYPNIYQGQLEAGSLWQKDFEVTIGSKVASKTGLVIGRQFAGVHGLSAESDDVHESTPYTVTGIFKETGTVLDQLILTNIESVWKIHDSHEHHHEHSEAEKDHDNTTDGGHDHEHDADSNHSHEEHEHEKGENHKEITILLIQYQSPMGAITLPRLINKSTNMQAASPVQEINRLYSLLGVGIEALTYISGFIILISALSILISLLNSLKERKYELALIRVMGGSRFRLFVIVILEGISFAIIGYIVGFVTSRFMMLVLSTYTDNNFNYTFQQWVTPIDLLLLIASLIIGIIAATIPAIKAMKTNISKTLSQ